MHDNRFLAATPGLLAVAVLGVCPWISQAAGTPRSPVTTEYHGIPVSDPYQWLEASKDPAVAKWTAAQNRAARAHLDALPARTDLKYQLNRLYGAVSADYTSLQFRKDRFFALKFKPPAQQAVLVQFQVLTNLSDETVVLDPNTLDTNGTTSIDFYAPSRDGRLVAVSLSENGSETGTVYVYEVDTGRRLTDVVPRVQYPTGGGSVAWNADGSGFFYTRYPAPSERPAVDRQFYQQVYFHSLGTPTTDDRYEIGDEFPRIAEIQLKSSDDGRQLVATVANGDGGDYAHYFRNTKGQWAVVASLGEGVKRVEFGRDPFYLEWPRDNALYLLSTKGAPKGRILRLPIGETNLATANEVIKQGTNVIASFVVSSSGIYVEDLVGGPSSLWFRSFYLKPDGKPESSEPDDADAGEENPGEAGNEANGNANANAEDANPNANTNTGTAANSGPETDPDGNAAGQNGERRSRQRQRPPQNEWRVPVSGLYSLREMICRRGDELIFLTSENTSPKEWLVYDPAVSRSRARSTELDGASPADFRDIEVLQESAVSRDGTKVPMTIMRRRGTRLDGLTPTILKGYGGFGISVTPSFNFANRVWFDQGGMVVVANVRGGGEFGEEWHKAGKLTRKQNVFDDFIACAEFLIRSNYTSAPKLAIEGGSNGGLLMGAALTQRPDLFRAVASHVGIYDMLRLELDSNGQFNTTEYGSVKDLEQFRALHAYSPYHRVQDRTAYPAVLLLTGENDGRVNPAHSRKMAARLQAATMSRHAILLRTSSSGHGLGTALDERIAQLVDVYAFLFDELGAEYTEVGRGPWVGGVTTTSATAKAKLARPNQTARLALSTSPSLWWPRYIGAARSDTNHHNVVEFVLDRLRPDTRYYYAVEVDGRLDRARSGQFRTFPETPKAFSFAFASCARTASTSDVFDAIRGNDPLFYMNIGDFHYLDLTNSNIGKFREAYDLVLSSPQQAALYRNTAFFYMWDDHDYGGNNANKKATSQEAVRLAYREYAPHYPLAAGDSNAPIYQSFSVGRTKFIITDLRSERDSVTNKDDVAKSMLGTRQKEWFKQELLAANGKFPVIFWVSTVPWLGKVGTNYYRVTTNDWGFLHHTTLTNAPRVSTNASRGLTNSAAVLTNASSTLTNASNTRTNRDAGGRGGGGRGGRGSGRGGGGGGGGTNAPARAPGVGDQDHWSVFSTERTEICDFIKANNIQGVAILHGDSHMLAADDGSNGDFATGGGVRIPVMCGGPLDQNPSLKGGPYSQGVYRVRGREGGFGFITVTDHGSEIEVKYSGRNNKNDEKVSLRYVVPALPGPPRPSETTARR